MAERLLEAEIRVLFSGQRAAADGGRARTQT
jgi:hypothetical protein